MEKVKKELLKCRICGREGLYIRLNTPFHGRMRVLCENENFVHGVRNGEHIIINTSDEEANPIPLELCVQ